MSRKFDPGTLPPSSIAYSITSALVREMNDAGGDLVDPETWEHMFEDDLTDAIKNAPRAVNEKDSEAYTKLAEALFDVADIYLIPMGLREAEACFKNYIAPALVQVALKDDATAHIVTTRATDAYANNHDIWVASVGKKILTDIKLKSKDVQQHARFNAAARPLLGKTVVFTGALSITRKDAQAQAKALGALIGSSITQATDMVVVGDNAGAKRAKAEALGIRTLTEHEWQAVCAPLSCGDSVSGVTINAPARDSLHQFRIRRPR